MYKYKGNKQQHVFLTQTRSQLIFLHVLPPSCMIVWHGFHVCMASTVMPSEIFINTKSVWRVTQCPHDLAWIKIQFKSLFLHLPHMWWHYVVSQCVNRVPHYTSQACRDTLLNQYCLSSFAEFPALSPTTQRHLVPLNLLWLWNNPLICPHNAVSNSRHKPTPMIHM